MPFWHVTLTPGSPVVHLVKIQEDDEGGVGAWDVEIWRGAPSWDSHPELEHAVLGLMNLSVHADFIRHRWTFDVPDRWSGRWNCGDDREWMVLSATGGPYNWTLVLRFPKRAPQFVWAAVAQGFHARLVGTETEMAPASAELIHEGERASLPASSEVEKAEQERDAFARIGQYAFSTSETQVFGTPKATESPEIPTEQALTVDTGAADLSAEIFTAERIATEPLVIEQPPALPVIDLPVLPLARFSLAQRLALARGVAST